MRTRAHKYNSLGSALVNIAQNDERFYSFPRNQRVYNTLFQTIKRNEFPITVRIKWDNIIIGDTKRVKEITKGEAEYKCNTRMMISALRDMCKILDKWSEGFWDSLLECISAPETYSRPEKITHKEPREETFTIGKMRIYNLSAEGITKMLEKYGNAARFVPTDAEIDNMVVPGFLPDFNGSCTIDAIDAE